MFPLLPVLVENHGVLKWVPEIAQGRWYAQCPSLPDIHADGLVEVSCASQFLPSALLLPKPSVEKRVVYKVRRNVRLAIANVLSLKRAGRRAFLSNQFHVAGLHLIGVQEARTKGPDVLEDDNYIMVSGGCTAAGERGCELWISKQLPWTDAASSMI